MRKGIYLVPPIRAVARTVPLPLLLTCMVGGGLIILILVYFIPILMIPLCFAFGAPLGSEAALLIHRQMQRKNGPPQ